MVARLSRRRYLEGAALATVVLAGCGGPAGDGEDGAAGLQGSDYPPVDEWLTDTTVGDADDTYDGTLVDLRDNDEVDIDVGSEGNGGNFAFGPSAAVVSVDTTVRWVWTGEGDAHNVEADPEEQLGLSDYTFTSGQPVESDSEVYTQTLDGTGVALYHCEPHLGVGMKGGIAVE
ncbi:MULTISPECIES: halocyanin domain-containing protein [Salinibaculum]|uniref:halocyanin domain-containing protein n=1 Tax=Salinibaculum TaxID=2732368 RepID=UPI0030CFB6B9